ncbi:hypothetical protein [uncultured Microbacterium sp.]|uniref:hypothetical protein n=1 Tax=uncultured Microbacterium sp. TaxID=191216 RepID=UPI0025E34F7B|nr:hypothetical protein [uncultured Microbacterium sp.]
MDDAVRRVKRPAELDYLVEERQVVPPGKFLRTADPWAYPPPLTPRFTGAAVNRFASLSRQEMADGHIAVVHPPWLGGRAIPRLIVTARYAKMDAFGASRLLADLDLAARRAGAMQRQLLRGDGVKKWPSPLRTTQGGLRLLDARVGSFDILLTLWGSLVTIAGSSPVTVAGLMALAWDVGRGSYRLGKKWVAASLTEALDEPPSLEPAPSAQPWGIQHTKSLAPRMSEAIANDQGFEFVLNETERTMKFIVPPKE